MISRLLSMHPENYVFLVTILIGAILLFLNNTYKDMTARFLSQTIFLPYYAAIDLVPTYREFKAENEQLRQRVIELSRQNQRAQTVLIENERLKELLQFKDKSQRKFISARVVSQFYEGRSISYVLNEGSTAGIQINDSVVTPEGLIGRVLAVNPSTSIVQTLFDPNCRVGAQLQQNRTLGIVLWKSGRFLRLEKIPIDVEVKKGELAITSGMGGIFPAGFPIGYVTDIQKERTGLFFDIQLVSAADFSRINHVFVVSDTTRLILTKPSPN